MTDRSKHRSITPGKGDIILLLGVIVVIAIVFAVIYIGMQPPPIGCGFEPMPLNDAWATALGGYAR